MSASRGARARSSARRWKRSARIFANPLICPTVPARSGRRADEGPILLRPIGAVAGIAETGHDIGVVVEAFVDRRGPDRNVGVAAAQPFDAFRSRQEADEADVLGAALLDAV